jgi:hypothetical protein
MYNKKLNLFSIPTLIGIITIVELVSLFSYRTFWLNSLFCILIIITTFIVSLKRLEYGLYILFAELFLGSFGYLFFITYGSGVSDRISVRIGIFVSILMAWLIRSFSFKTIIQQFKTNRLYQLFGLFLLCLIYGVILGLIHKNSLNNILADGQRYLYFGLLFIVTEVITTLEHIYRLLRIFIATLVTMGIKTLILFYIFTHNLWNEFEVRFFYKWVRDTRVG